MKTFLETVENWYVIKTAFQKQKTGHFASTISRSEEYFSCPTHTKHKKDLHLRTCDNVGYDINEKVYYSVV